MSGAAHHPCLRCHVPFRSRTIWRAAVSGVLVMSPVYNIDQWDASGFCAMPSLCSLWGAFRRRKATVPTSRSALVWRAKSPLCR
jgi:hypothetical protein